ncbi:MAG TPA: discoidin domain-containing protein, partial [Candidatus Sumerlaeota bacterium]|nr:discoidin domain-containing protein [Candidatus Sumerlaeota bacterium]
MDSKTFFLLLAGFQFTLSSLILPALAAETKASPDTPSAAATSVLQGKDGLTPDQIRAFEGEWTKRMQALRQRRNSLASDAAGGNDGLKTGEFGFHTNATPEPSWWQVDLQTVCPLDRVVVFNRNTISQRALKLKILLSDDGQNWKEVYQHDGSLFLGGKQKPLTVPLPGQKTRFVRIQIPANEYLHLDEIEVYGADDKEKNIALKKPALQSTISDYSTFSGAVLDAPFDQDEVTLAQELVATELAGVGSQAASLLADSAQLIPAGPSEGSRLRWIALYARAATLGRNVRETRREIEMLNPEALRLAIEDLNASFPGKYTG